MADERRALRLMVSSTVYDIRYLLDQIEASLRTFGYDPWISAKGSIPVDPNLGNFDNCLRAVRDCDLFFAIITPAYGTGKEEKDGQSITHREILEAVRLDKLRWFVCHENVMTARSFLADLKYEGNSLRGPKGRDKLTLKEEPAILKNLKTIDMLEAATRDDVRDIAKRTGNWVQPYVNDRQVLDYLATQFGEPDRIRQMIKDREERLAAPSAPDAQVAAQGEIGVAEPNAEAADEMASTDGMAEGGHD